MHAKLGCLAALTAVVAASAAASDVVDLGKDTFDDFVKDNNLVLAECECASSVVVSNVQLA